MPDFEARSRLLEIENEELRQRILVLEEQIGVYFDSPAFLGLSPSEAKVFGILIAREAVTKRLVMDTLYGNRPDGDTVEEKIVDVFVCKLRAKLKAFGITIKTNWGQGYFMTAEMKRRVRELMAAQEVAA